MLEPVSIGLVGYAALNAVARPGRSAVSGEAQAVRQAAAAVVESVQRSQALFGAKLVAIAEILVLASECAEPGWDGADASPLERLAAISAEEFIRALPDGVPLPEFSPEPDGSISLDWIESRHRMLSVSIGTTDRLAYAWLDGTDRGHGVARFDGEIIPARIMESILGITSNGKPALRAA
jgi:hypothetical protein